jgi:glutathione synthase
MTKKLAIQMNEPQTLKFATDTTMLLGREAVKRGYEIYYYQPAALNFNNGELTALARKIEFFDDANNFYKQGDIETINLHEFDVVLMRQDPPFDMAYITATHLLEKLQPKVLVVNDPSGVRNSPEKLFPFDFPEFIPPTLITRSVNEVEEFLTKQQDIVLKPLYGYAGQSVFRIKQGDSNLNSLLEMFFATSIEPIIAQKFIPEIKTMDKRVIVIDGKVTAIMGRVPASNDIRANFRVGGTGLKIDQNERDVMIGEKIGIELKKRKIMLAGIDIIGDYLTEINVTCPTGLIKSNALYGLKQESIFWDAVENRLK